MCGSFHGFCKDFRIVSLVIFYSGLIMTTLTFLE
jgi:hypothetical protein